MAQCCALQVEQMASAMVCRRVRVSTSVAIPPPPRRRPAPAFLPTSFMVPSVPSASSRSPLQAATVHALSRIPSTPLRTFCSAAGSDREKAVAFVIERGYSAEIAEAIAAALLAPGSGVPDGMLLIMVTNMAGHWEIGEDAGLEALAKSVEQELAKRSGKSTVHFKVWPPGAGKPFECEGLEGMSLKEIAEHGESVGAQTLGEYLECACAGLMACSTCHVYVDEDWSKAVGPPSEEEQDMIELAHEPKETSRLGCQIRLKPNLEGLVVKMPGGANNLFDHIPFT